MNRKGFTLIELLAVIILLGIVLVFAVPNISSAYKNSKLKSEEIFVDRLSDVIDSYVKLNSSEITFTSDGTAIKDEEGSTYTVSIYRGKVKEQDIVRKVTVQDIINDNLMSLDDYINAGNKEVTCSASAEIEVYKDSDYVYCYKVKKDSLGCLTTEYINSTTEEYAIDTCIWSR